MSKSRSQPPRPVSREIVAEILQNDQGKVSLKIPVSNNYGGKIRALSRTWDFYSLNDLSVHWISSLGNLTGGNVSFYFEKDPSTTSFPSSFTEISQQAGSHVAKINSSSSKKYSGLTARKLTKTQPQPTAHMYGYIVALVEAPLSDVPAGTRLGYFEISTHPTFSVQSFDDTIVAYDPVDMVPMLQTKDDTFYLSCRSFDQAQDANSGVVFSFLEQAGDQPVNVWFGSSTSTNVGFPEGTNADLSSFSLEDLVGEVYYYAKEVPGVTNIVDAGAKVYKVFKDEASAVINSGAAVIGNWVAENIGTTVCGELSDLGNTAVSAFDRGCRTQSTNDGVVIPQSAKRYRAFARASDGALILDNWSANLTSVSAAFALIGGETKSLLTTNGTFQNVNGYGYLTDAAGTLGTSRLSATQQAMITSNPGVCFTIYLAGVDIVQPDPVSITSSSRSFRVKAAADGGVWKLPADSMPASLVFSSGISVALLRVDSTENATTISGTSPTGLSYIPYLIGSYIGFLDPNVLSASQVYFASDPGFVTFSMVWSN
jgi:hypothetical protein